MNKPPNRQRDDRRMHECDKPGLGVKVNDASQDDVRPARDADPSGESSTTDRDQPSALDGDVATRSRT